MSDAPSPRYSRDLTAAVDSLFRPLDSNGFWDPDRGTIVRALEYDDAASGGHREWSPDRRQLWRYGPFALMGVLYWRRSRRGSAGYDDRIRAALDHAATAGSEFDAYAEMPSYGLGSLLAAFSMAVDVFGDERYRRQADRIYEHATPLVPHHSEDALLVYGGTFYDEIGGAASDDLSAAVDAFIAAADDDGLLAFEDDGAGWSKGNSLLTGVYDVLYGGSRPRRHQNQMYALWALCRACEVTGRTDGLDLAERVLEYTIEHRMRDDGAFIWEDVSRASRLRGAALSRLGLRTPHWEFLYACHQTFFVNAVSHYAAAGGDRDYDDAVADAMEWLYGTNVRNEDLAATSGIGVPMRQMTTDGGMDEPDQMYKGTYEVGSHVMALTNLLEWPVAASRAPDAEVPAR